jgi:hypothetical protein
VLNFFTVVFSGLEKFGRKNAQFRATRRNRRTVKILASAKVRKLMKTRKNSFLNYKSAALPTELCRQKCRAH